MGPNWIVEPDNHDQLTPIGCVGELVVQGRALAREYINESQKTKAAFLDNLGFLPKSSHPSRFYKTGDLVRYNTNGTLEYIGRSDSQVKLRGQRIEVAEIEYAIKATSHVIEHVAVEKIHTETGDTLLAFVSFNEENKGRRGDQDLPLLQMDDGLRASLNNIVLGIRKVLPSYMIPSFFLPIHTMPFVSSMKLNRKSLRTLASELPAEDLAAFLIAATKEKVELTTDMELKLRELWAQVLKTSPTEIGKTDKFLEIGGDSISAIHLVSLAQEHGISITVTQIFEDSTLARLAIIAVAGDGINNFDTAPFDMIAPADLESTVLSMRQQCKLKDELEIEDIYPCTTFQEGIMALAVKQPGSHVAQHVYEIDESVDVEKFKRAFELTMKECGNLRTRVAFVGDTCLQAVIKNDLEWENTNNHTLSSYMTHTGSFNMQYGTKLSRHAIVQDSDYRKYFVWVMHHAVFDGWTVNLMLDVLHRSYMDQVVTGFHPYSSFIKYTTSVSRDDAAAFWSCQLHGAQKATFPRTPAVRTPSKSTKRTFMLQQPTNSAITKATIIRAAFICIASLRRAHQALRCLPRAPLGCGPPG